MNSKILLLAAILTATTCQEFYNPFAISNPLTHYVEEIISTLRDCRSNIINSFEQQFNNFKNTFNKMYSSAKEQEKRFHIFTNNQKYVFNRNNFPNIQFTLKLNEYADLHSGEFNNLVNGLRIKREKGIGSRFACDASIIVPDNVDWRRVGAVTPARRQGQCASCYAFAAVAAIESHIFIKTGKLLYLSPQNIIDCSGSERYKNSGCISGTINFSFDFIKDNGIHFERSYPYEARARRRCKHIRDNKLIAIKGYVILDEDDEKGLEEAITTKGPVAAGIDASAPSFQFYGGGIYYEPSCSSSLDHINHAVLVIGFGTESDGQKYWLIKNSYGPHWGENGFAKIARNVTNHCGIATYALYPEV